MTLQDLIAAAERAQALQARPAWEKWPDTEGLTIEGWHEDFAGLVAACSPELIIALARVAEAAWAGQDPRTLKDALRALDAALASAGKGGE